MKVLLVSQYWAPENGVPQRRWSWLSSLLMEHGHDVTVICPPPHYNQKVTLSSWLKNLFRPIGAPILDSDGPNVIRIRFQPFGTSLTSRAFNQLLVAVGMIFRIIGMYLFNRKSKPDLIVGTVPAIPTAFVTFIVARVLRVNYVIDLRDAWPDLLKEGANWNKGIGRASFVQAFLNFGSSYSLAKIIEKFLYVIFRNASGIIVTSSALGVDLLKRPQMHGVAPVVETIYNLFPLKESSSSQDSKNREHITGKLNVLYAGTLGRAQNLLNALEAIKLANRQGVNVRLHLVGAGAMREELQRKIKEESLNVQIFERMPAESLDSFYGWADTALVHLTDWIALSRTVPSKTFDLMERKIHITGVIQGETKDLIEKLQAGHVVPPEDPASLAELWVNLANETLSLEIGEEARRWVVNQRSAVYFTKINRFVEIVDK